MKRIIAVAALLVLALSGAAFAKEAKIADILKFKELFKNERVSVVGFVNQIVEDNAKSTKVYKLQDDYAERIDVRTSAGLPEVGKRVAVEGMVTQEGDTLYIMELSRTDFSPKIPGPEYDQKIMYALVAAGVIFLLLLVVVVMVIVMRRMRSQEEELPVINGGGERLVDEGKTVQLKRTQDTTMKLLPGKFRIVKGDEKDREIRLYMPKDARNNMEFTIGSLPIPEANPFSHIRIAANTVSRNQAKLVYDGSSYTLTNISTVNNTIINGKTMTENEAITLNDGDLLVMGEIEFRYEAK
jgi:FHA domain